MNNSSINANLKTEVEDICQQIINLVSPISIYLLGSSIKNEMNENSDIDWMIVLDDKDINRRKVSQFLYKNIKRQKFPCDFIVTNTEQLEKQKHNIGLIYYYILNEGKCIYAR